MPELALSIYLRKISFKEGDVVSSHDFSADSLKGKKNIFDFLFNISDKSKIDHISDETELNFDVGDSPYIFKISRELEKSGVFEEDKKVGENFIEFLKSEFDSKITSDIWQKFFIDHSRLSDITALQKYISNLTGALKTDTPKVDTSSLQSELESIKTQTQNSEKLERYREVGMRIKSLEKTVDLYQNGKKDREGKEKELKQIESEVKAIEDKLASVESITKSINEVRAKLGTNFSQEQFTQMQSHVMQIKQMRGSKIQAVMKSARAKYSVNTAKEDSKDFDLFEGKWFFALAGIQVVISILLTITTFQIIHLAIGLLSTLLICFSVMLFNVYRFSSAHEIVEVEEQADPGKYSFEKVVGEYNQDENNLIVGVAMKKAYIDELNGLNNSIKQRLGETDYNATVADLQDKKKKVSEFKSELRKLKGSNMSSEEYYKKRRELDILKIEKENIEYDNKDFANDNETKIVELMVKIEEANNITDSTVLSPIFLMNSPGGDIVDMVRGFLEDQQIILI